VSRFQVVCQVTSEMWVSVNDALTFLPCREANRVRFIWASKESGYNHLYLIEASTAGLMRGDEADEDGEPAVKTTSNDAALLGGQLKAKMFEKRMLTRGDWCVSDQPVWVNTTLEIVFFVGYKDTPLEKHLYCVSTARPGEVRRLTNSGFSNNVHMNEVSAARMKNSSSFRP